MSIPLPSAVALAVGMGCPLPEYVYDPHCAAPEPNARLLLVARPMVVIVGVVGTISVHFAADASGTVVLASLAASIGPPPPVTTPGVSGCGPVPAWRCA